MKCYVKPTPFAIIPFRRDNLSIKQLKVNCSSALLNETTFKNPDSIPYNYTGESQIVVVDSYLKMFNHNE